MLTSAEDRTEKRCAMPTTIAMRIEAVHARPEAVTEVLVFRVGEEM